ncbi:MAG: hypothetical protein CM1200mP23_0140 [Nitrososphaerota archaeon]|nr:MAG: hypothetical protein CM1200mP23_0140 [Nitrososphaerota archaeon]
MEHKKILENLSIEKIQLVWVDVKIKGRAMIAVNMTLQYSMVKKKSHFLNVMEIFTIFITGHYRKHLLIFYYNIWNAVLLDEQWELHMLLSKIKEKKQQISNAYVKNCLVEAGVCITKARQGFNDPYSSSWVKCAAYFLLMPFPF